MLVKKLFVTLVKMARYTVQGYCGDIGIGTTTKGFCSRGARSGSTPNTAKTSENLQPRNSLGGSVGGKLLRGNIGRGDSG